MVNRHLVRSRLSSGREALSTVMSDHVLARVAGCPRSLELAVSASTLFQTVPREMETQPPSDGSTPGRGKTAGLAWEPGFCRLWGDKKQIRLVVAWGTGVRAAL